MGVKAVSVIPLVRSATGIISQRTTESTKMLTGKNRNTNYVIEAMWSDTVGNCMNCMESN